MSERLHNNYEPSNPPPETSSSSDLGLRPNRIVQQPPHNATAGHPTSSCDAAKTGARNRNSAASSSRTLPACEALSLSRHDASGTREATENAMFDNSAKAWNPSNR